MQTLAAIFDSLKIKNPVAYAIIVVVLLMADSFIGEIIVRDLLSDKTESILNVISQIIVLVLSAIGVRTSRYLTVTDKPTENDSNDKR
jgi:hypothetical protein